MGNSAIAVSLVVMSRRQSHASNNTRYLYTDIYIVTYIPIQKIIYIDILHMRSPHKEPYLA